MTRSRLLIAGYLLLLVGAIFALSRFHAAEADSHRVRVDEYSHLMAHYLWTTNTADAEDFLKIITADSRITAVYITDAKERPFIIFERDLTGVSSFHSFLQKTIHTPIEWSGERIGQLTIICNVYNLAFDFYIGSILLILAAALTYYLSYISKQGELEDLSRRTTAIFTNTSEAIFLADMEGKIQSVNPAFEAIMGYRQEEIVGKNALYLISPRYGTEAPLEWWKDAVSVGQWQGEFWIRRKNGEEIPIATSVSGIPGKDGRFELMTAMSRDITERKKAETSLLEAKERLAQAESLAHLGSWTWDITTGEILASDEVCQIFGVDPSDHPFKKRSFLSFIHPNDYSMTKHILLGCIADKAHFSGIFRIVRDDGGIRTIEVASRYIMEDGKETNRLVGFSSDITEQMRNEEALYIAKEEAERANLSKSRFLAAASHDLRQPLQALSMFIAALGESFRKQGIEEKDKQGRLIGNIENSIEALAGLLNSLLDISRLDAGIMEPEKETFPIAQTLGWIETTFTDEARRKGVDLRIVPCSASIETDPNLFQRIAANLVSNAVRYTEQGRILVGCRRVGKQIRFEVWDTGEGIPEDKMDTVFQEFQQLGNPGRQRKLGLGLGLAIVERVAGLLNLKLFARSTPGKGSVFSVTAPIKKTAIADHTAKPITEPRPHSTRPNIMVIDDDPSVLDAMTVLMETWDFNVLSASSAEAALRECRNHKKPLDLIVADYRLQTEQTGADTIHRMNHELGWSVPGIIITGDTAPERLQEAAASGFNLLHKPVQPDVLKKLIDQALNR